LILVTKILINSSVSSKISSNSDELVKSRKMPFSVIPANPGSWSGAGAGIPARNAPACEAGGGAGSWIFQRSLSIQYLVISYSIVRCKDSFIKILISVYPG